MYVNAIGTDHDDFDRSSEELDDAVLSIVDEQSVRDEFVCSYHGVLDDGLPVVTRPTVR